MYFEPSPRNILAVGWFLQFLLQPWYFLHSIPNENKTKGQMSELASLPENNFNVRQRHTRFGETLIPLRMCLTIGLTSLVQCLH
jgi:hypothetical protein